jgi:hypothetical protein
MEPDMTSTSLKSVALITLSAAATTFLIQACGGSAEAQGAPDTPNAVEGVWEATVTIKDCTSGAVQRTFKGESMFHRGGTMTADNSMPVPSRGAAFGVWRQDSASGYTAKFHFLRFNPDGTLAGSQRVVRTIVLSTDGNSMTSTIAGQLLDTADVVTAPICGTEAGTRLY